MTDRDINGNAARSQYRKARRLADEFGLTPEALETIAQGVREFDEQGTVEQRTARALEKIAQHTTPERDKENGWAWEDRRLRRREVYAQELLAVAMFAEDINDEHLVAIRGTHAFQRLIERLTAEPTVGDSATPSS